MDNYFNMIKRCRVCSDKAIGFNFNGLSCGSCKSFFRRNAMKHEHFKCRKEGNCQIDMDTRKCCTKCRLDKCVKIGMSRDLITFNPKEEFYNTQAKLNLTKIQKSAKRSKVKNISLENIIEISIQRNLISIDPLTSESLRDTFSQMCNIELNEYEQERIKEVQSAVSVFQDENSVPLVADATDLIYVLNLSEYYIRQTIKFCKNMQVFKNLHQDDQLGMIKSFFTELLIIRLVFFFDLDKDGYPAIKDVLRNQAIFIKMSVLLSEKEQDLLSYCRKYAADFSAELDQDTTIRDLLLVKRLFKPRDNNISCPEFIRYQYYIYRRLLQRYLEHKWKDPKKAKEQFDRIVVLLNEMNQMKLIVEALFVETDASQLANVLNEVFRC